jgi:hypothetical protein
MPVRIHFAGLTPGRPLAILAWAAFANDPQLAGDTKYQFGRELAAVFGNHWAVAPTAADCDVVVYAHDYEPGPDVERVAVEARAAGKPLLYFSRNENLPPSRLTHGTLYRSSIFERLPHERTWPSFIIDAQEEAGPRYPATLDKEPTPQVGFCGFVGTPWSRLGYRLLGQRQKVDGLALRARALTALQKSPRVRCDFIARAGYLGAAPLAAFEKDHPLATEREVFLDNLMRSPYGLALRGKGNHSVRFYEILSAGRIPLFINTGCVLPLESEIDWRRQTVWVEDRDLARIGDKLAAFHDAISPEAFLDLQRENRRIWLDRLRPEPYFRHVLETVARGQPAP